MSLTKRNFEGYGERPPDIQWPGGKKLAISLVLNYEGGGEMNVIDGDKSSEAAPCEFPSVSVPDRDLVMESLFEYESRVAIWRLLRNLDKHCVVSTFFATAKTLKSNPAAAREIVRRGHEICSHGYRWVEQSGMSKDEERLMINDTVRLIEEITGARPVGWYSRQPSVHTRELLAEEGGFIYDSDSYNDDLPFYENVSGRKFVVVPYTADVNDFGYYLNRFSNSDGFYNYLKDSFDWLHDEAKFNGKMMSVAVHLRITGRPGRISALDRFLSYSKTFDDVWFATRRDIAKWWIDHYG